MNGLEAIKEGAVFVLLLTAARTDIRSMRVPNRLLAAGAAFRVLLYAFECKEMGETGFQCCAGEMAESIAFVLALSCLAVLSCYCLGFGDVKLLGLVSLYVGMGQACSCLAYGILLAGSVCICLLALGQIDRKTPLPLAPFLLGGYVLQLWL